MADDEIGSYLIERGHNPGLLIDLRATASENDFAILEIQRGDVFLDGFSELVRRDVFLDIRYGFDLRTFCHGNPDADMSILGAVLLRTGQTKYLATRLE